MSYCFVNPVIEKYVHLYTGLKILGVHMYSGLKQVLYRRVLGSRMTTQSTTSPHFS